MIVIDQLKTAGWLFTWPLGLGNLSFIQLSNHIKWVKHAVRRENVFSKLRIPDMSPQF